MKVLIAGNSQASPLMLALRGNLFPRDSGLVLAFNVTPGGTGPHFGIENGKLKVLDHSGPYAPHVSPADVADMRISDFDAIVVSALGFVDGGFAYPSTLVSRTVVAEFGPKPALGDVPMISQSCFRDILSTALESHPGFRFLRLLQQGYTGRILVQPFPYLSDVMIDRADWRIRRQYEDALGFHEYLNGTRDNFLERLCTTTLVELLPRPQLEARAPFFAPAAIMSERDGLHPKPEYGALVLEGIRNAVL